MRLTFQLELDKGPASPHDPCSLEISRDTNDNIRFNILSGGNQLILAGTCEPSELFKLASMLGEEPND